MQEWKHDFIEEFSCSKNCFWSWKIVEFWFWTRFFCYLCWKEVFLGVESRLLTPSWSSGKARWWLATHWEGSMTCPTMLPDNSATLSYLEMKAHIRPAFYPKFFDQRCFFNQANNTKMFKKLVFFLSSWLLDDLKVAFCLRYLYNPTESHYECHKHYYQNGKDFIQSKWHGSYSTL